MSETAVQSTQPSFSIAPATGVGAVHLGVTDGAQAVAFYRDVVGLAKLSEDEERIAMGAGGKELVVLYPGAGRAVVERTSGLYHLAIVLPSRRELAVVIARLMSLRYPNSPTDHTMTKSDYLWDPDGNGIEIYCESPEDGTFGFADGMFVARATDGTLRSGRDPIDLDALFEHLQQGDDLRRPLPDTAHMGHVHLHVADLKQAVDFYHGLIGFDVMGVAERWGAAFVSAGGYHHHLGLNTWAGQGAPQAPPTAAGLRHYSVELPDEAALTAVTHRLTEAGVPLERLGDDRVEGWKATDPAGNKLHLIALPKGRD